MSCLICGGSLLADRLDLGSQPVSSWLQTDPRLDPVTVQLELAQCGRCGAVQLAQPTPHEKLVPPVFIAAREPEEHLDGAVEKIMRETGLGPAHVVVGLTYKDDTTLERFRKRGIGKTWRVSLADLDIVETGANIETIQNRTTAARMAELAARQGQADLLVARHICEHAEHPSAFLQGLAELVKPGGYLLIEIPDCTNNLTMRDYCMLWEEHSLYLTPSTFALLPSLGGFESRYVDVHPLPFENCLVQLCQRTTSPCRPVPSECAKSEIGLLRDYARDYAPIRATLRDRMAALQRERGTIALFGAGHLAATFVNVMGVVAFIEFVADDTPEKQGKYLPGTGLRIVPSDELVRQGIGACLLALSIQNEDRVISRNQGFVDCNGLFLSIFRASPRSIFNTAARPPDRD